MKLLLILSLAASISFAQNKQLLYGFKEIPQSFMLNPGGQINNSGYIGSPLLSQIHLSAGTSGFTVYDLFADNDIDFNTKLRNVIYKAKPRNFTSVNQQIEMLSAGFAIGDRFKKNEYISFGLYQELDAIAYYPKDHAILAFEGNQNNINRVFNAKHLKLSAEVLSVFHVGYNKKINNQFTYGIRAKLYSNILNINSVNNEGSFVTVVGNNNIYNHIFNLDLELRTSGLAGFKDSDTDDVSKELKKRALMGGDKGLGFDVGFTYQIDKQWYVDGSLLDIGFINHSKAVESYTVNGNYQFEGINPFFSELETGLTANDYWRKIEKDFTEVFEPDTTNTKFTTWRPIKFNASINYEFGRKNDKDCDCFTKDQGFQNAVGAQLFAVNRPKQPQAALTLYYYRKLFKGLAAKTTYTIDSFSLNNIGLGMSVNFGPINLYVMADNLLQYKNIYNAQSVSLQLGLNYIFKKNDN